MRGEYIAFCGRLSGYGRVPPREIYGCGKAVRHHGQAVHWPGEKDWVIYHPECLPCEVVEYRRGRSA